MKKIKNYFKALFLVLFVVACTEDDIRDINYLSSIELPTNVSAAYSITQDNSGLVTITPSGDGVVSYDINFGDSTDDPYNVSQGGSVEHTYLEGTYEIEVIAYNLYGDAVSVTQELIVSFQAPQNLVVLVENDAALTKLVNVTATADFATTYEFYSGEDGVTQPVATANIGDAISYQYAEPGVYNISVIAMGGAIATTEYTAEFEVTEILAPIASAPAAPNRDAGNVISIFSSVYEDVVGTDTFPDWGQAGQGSAWGTYDLNGDSMLQYTNLSYQGIQIGSPQDLTSMEFIHLDVWTADSDYQLETSLISLTNGEKPVVSDLTANAWTSLDIPLSAFTDQGLTVADIHQLKFVGIPWATGTVFIDNVYFYKVSSASTFDDGLLSNGDFESGSESWLIGVDDTTSAPVATNAGNTHYSVNVSAAGNPWEVNASQKVEIIEGNSYTLTFDAWSDVNRSMIAGIGLSADPWSSSTELVDITSTRTTYMLTLSAADFGAVDARVIFDLGADAGLVNIDNVSLFIGNGNLVTNGNFENGSESWIVGVDDNAPAPTALTAGNTHYFVDVTVAGNPWEVNLSQKLEIIEGNTYTLTFDAWSDVNRSIVSGIGLSADPWSSSTELVDITPSRTTYMLTLSSADFGASDARVIFDLGADAGTVNIDNVSLSLN